MNRIKEKQKAAAQQKRNVDFSDGKPAPKKDQQKLSQVIDYSPNVAKSPIKNKDNFSA